MKRVSPAVVWAVTAFLGLLVVYAPLLRAPWSWDDVPTIALNASVGRPQPWSAFFDARYFGFSGEASWRPIATLSYRALRRVFGPSPAPQRAAGLVLHAANAALLCALALELGAPAAAAAAGAALFALHAAHVETLLCVSFNEELLVAFFLLLMLLAHRRGRTLLASLALACALLSKESGMAGPLLAAALDFSFERPGWWKKKRAAYASYAAVAGLYLWARFYAIASPAQSPAPALSAARRAVFAAQSLLTTLRVFFLPARLSIEYFALPVGLWTAAAALTGAAAAAAAGALLLRRLWRRKPALFFFCVWALPFLAATSPLLPASQLSTRLFAERWLYLPALGACAALGLALPRKAAAGLAALWLSLAAVRAQDWRSESSLWLPLTRRYPWSAKAWEGLGEALMHEGRWAEAREDFGRALELRRGRRDEFLRFYVPRAPGTLSWERGSLLRWLGVSDLRLGRAAEARGWFEQAAALEPGDIFSLRALSYIDASAGDFRDARRWIGRGLSVAPNDGFLLRLQRDVKARRLTFRAQFS